MKKLTFEQFVDKARSIHGDKYGYGKGTYLGTHIKFCFTCFEHGDFWQTPHNHLAGQGCSSCGYIKNSLFFKSTIEEFIEKANKIHNNKYKYPNAIYLSANKKLLITCENHGDFEQTPNNHLNGQGCPFCYKEIVGKWNCLTTEEFIKRAIEIHGDKYDYSKVNYSNSQVKVCIICPEHGEFWQTPNDHIYGHGCLKCNDSKGEKLIIDILDENNIEYIREYKIPEQIYKFRYDFYLPRYNILIEFHGIQHYKPVEFFGGEEAFKELQFRDMFKKELAKELKIQLIEFNYKQLNKTKITEMLLNALKRKKHGC